MSNHLLPRPLPAPPDGPERLLAAALDLAVLVHELPGPPDLVGLVDLAAEGEPTGPAGRPDALALGPLEGPDPVAGLLGVVAPASWWAVGIASGGRARPLDGEAGTPGPDIAFVHLVARDGTAVGVIAADGGPTAVEGPSRDPQVGRVPDLCRRALGLPTPPPPGGLGPHLVDLWLHRVTRAADRDPALRWSTVAALHPAAPVVEGAAEPAALVRATATLADRLDWDRYRQVCAGRHGTPTGELDATAAAWLDAGSFARWVLGEAVPWPQALDRLDAVLPPATADRVFATVRLSPAARLAAASGLPLRRTSPRERRRPASMEACPDRPEPV